MAKEIKNPGVEGEEKPKSKIQLDFTADNIYEYIVYVDGERYKKVKKKFQSMHTLD